MINVETYRAVLKLASASAKELDEISKQLWSESQTKQTERGKKHFVLASGIAVLVRDRVRS